MSTSLNRRTFVTASTLALAGIAHGATMPLDSRQASGVRIGEPTHDSIIIRVRLTKEHERNNDGVLIPGRANGKKADQLAKVSVPVDDLEGACPGATGRVRLRYATNENLRDATTTEWFNVREQDDYTHHFHLTNLQPGTQYHFASETSGPDGMPMHASVTGMFRTAPASDKTADVRLCVMTCQGYPDRGHPDGHAIYPSMLALKPDFACLTGDLVYYDNDEPRAFTSRLARFHWERMFSLPRLREFTRQVGCYWLKDDHDTLNNDVWAGKTMGELTFAEGQKIFRQQTPVPAGLPYRTVRWGRDLQVWIVEGRDFRSANTMADGPAKTIWGAEQKAWFKKTVSESDATWKILVSPTPLVGPDRASGKNDNHSNAGFQHEGDELRNWIKEHSPDNLFVICGDRHWQYHSVHPLSGLNELSVGPASNEHAGGTPGENKQIHRFHRVKGGFLSVTISRKADKPSALFELRDVDGQVVYSWSATK